MTKKIQAEFESWLEGEVLKQAQKLRHLPEYHKLLAELAERIASGCYSFGGAACQQALGTPAGGAKLLLLLLKGHQQTTEDDVEDLLVHHSDEVRVALENLLGKQQAAKEAASPPSQ